MTPELVITALLDDSSLTDLIGTRLASTLLPENTTYPAVVYQVISYVADPHLNYDEPQLVNVRVQITPLSTSIASVKSIHAVIRDLLDFKHSVTAATKTVVLCRFDSLQPLERDHELGLFAQSADYLLTYYE